MGSRDDDQAAAARGLRPATSTPSTGQFPQRRQAEPTKSPCPPAAAPSERARHRVGPDERTPPAVRVVGSPQSRWKTSCRPGGGGAAPHRPHHGRLLLALERPAPPAVWSTTSRSALRRQARGTCRAVSKPPRRASPRPGCGPPTPTASARSAASTPRRVLSTTGPASSSVRTWSGGANRLVTTTASKDPVFKKSVDRTTDVDAALIRNTYKVLLTRGMVGTIVYSTDPETREFLEQMCR